MRSTLFDPTNYEQNTDRFALQNSYMLRVAITPGYTLHAKRGSMVAFQGQLEFDHEGSGVGRFLKMAATGEAVYLMRCSGNGDVFLADGGQNIHIVMLEGEAISIQGSHLLALESSLQWDVSLIPGAGMLGGGMANVLVSGHGLLAVTTQKQPVLLDCSTQPTYVDTNAVIAWSANLAPGVNKTFKAGALIGRGSGEAVQLVFHGPGFVLVQPDEGMYAAAAAR